DLISPNLITSNFSLSLLNIIKLPFIGMVITSPRKANNVFSVFFLGMSSGLIVGPCTAPVLGTLLFYVASKQNLFHSISLLFIFSYGVGTSLILVGTFSGLLARLPKSGKWMEIVKKISGLILLVIAILFVIKIFPPRGWGG
ncbi:MAG TPA: cytochrome c biogenesis protein CcdA, partial [Candidatus Omnitrophota bacterium]|nr:cytochrome c biogenesis protein CcdA [Candidatus Omnitrophota bacterium]